MHRTRQSATLLPRAVSAALLLLSSNPAALFRRQNLERLLVEQRLVLADADEQYAPRRLAGGLDLEVLDTVRGIAPVATGRLADFIRTRGRVDLLLIGCIRHEGVAAHPGRRALVVLIGLQDAFRGERFVGALAEQARQPGLLGFAGLQF